MRLLAISCFALLLAGCAGGEKPPTIAYDDTTATPAQLWPYHPGALYQLYTAMGEVTDIALEPGEELSGDPAGGDTERWEVGSAESGSGAMKQVHILIKPKRPDLSANLVITTNRRTYHIELHSTPPSGAKPVTYMAAVSWDYPLDLKWKLDRRNAEATDKAAAVVDQ
jgi:type IV secretion system protein TrbG